MKRSISLLFLLLPYIPLILTFLPCESPPRPEFHPICQEMNKTQPLNYLGASLTVTSWERYLLLCPGDAFGDLNGTYVHIQDCSLTMYHKDRIIWSKGRNDSLKSEGKCSNDEYCFCVFSLKRDGHLVLYQEEIYYSYEGSKILNILERNGWTADFDPAKTELSLKGEQLQILRTYKDETQRLFYIDENHQVFTEDMGEPIKIADKAIIKSHQDKDKTILRRNEYIGNLKGTYLILQPNCKLQLMNKDKTIWSFTSPWDRDPLCDLNVAQDNTIVLFRRSIGKFFDGLSIIQSEANLEVVESKITFDDCEPIIIQTLKNGSELIFYGGRLKREPLQIAQKTLIAETKYSRSSNRHLHISEIPRMGYVGNLTGLHLILEHNCSLILANGNESLWELQSGPRDSGNAALECSVELQGFDGIILLESPYERYSLLGDPNEDSMLFTRVQLTLENDQIVIKRKRKGRDQLDIFHAGPQTNGSFFKFLGRNSVTIISSYSHYTEILPKMGYIGDLNRVYALLDQNCNLLLYNKTQVLWESGTSLDHTSDLWDSCTLGLDDDMQIKISATMPYRQRKTIWSAMDFRPHTYFGHLLKVELSIIRDELWLIYTSQDGTAHMEKASQGTNHFTNNLAQFQPPAHTDMEKLIFCVERNATQPLNYRAANLTSNSNDIHDLVLCLGDTFGDLNETYVRLENCSLTMYHKDNKIWASSAQRAYPWNEDDACAFSLQRDGNLVLYGETVIEPDPGQPFSVSSREWDSQTNFNPVKTELRLQDQQLQVVQTFRDGTQRLFYADEHHQEFTEDMGEPIKIADKFIIKNHSDLDQTILRRNEYIGDLNETHLILQPNCQLQLLNKNKIIWWFRPSFRHIMNCTLKVARDNQTIEISRGLADIKIDSFDEEIWIDNAQKTFGRESVIKHRKNLEIVQSQLTFKNDQLVIIQTLKDGSELILCGMPDDRDSRLTLKREPKQIAPKTLIIRTDDSSSEEDSDDDDDDDDDEDFFILERMNYIGNLTGLHLILEQNCSLILANANKKLWELQNNPYYFEKSCMYCSLRLEPSGEMYLELEWTNESPHLPNILGHLPNLLGDRYFSLEDNFVTEVELTLENDQLIVKRERRNRNSDVFYAGPKTNGTFFHFLAERSVVITTNEYPILSKLGYIGDLNGVYTILDKNCNWVLYNKTQVLWESGSFRHDWKRCALIKGKSRELRIYKTDWVVFSSPDSTESSLFKEVLRTEILVNNSGLWVIYTFRDGTVHKYQAIPGTNGFELVSKTYDFSFGLEL